MSAPIKIIKSITVTDAVLTSTSVAEDISAAWSSAATYALNARVHLASTHKTYQSIQAGNIGKDPATEPLWWAEVSATNRWKPFDLSSTTQAQIGANDHYEITPGQAVNAIALINIAGIVSVRIRVTDPDFGLVYDRTADLLSAPGEASWYAWFFGQRTQQTQFIDAGLPSYPNATVRIDITSAGSALVGGLVFGSQIAIGKGVRRGVRLGIQDFSRKERNEWGDTILMQRAYAKRLSFNTMIDNRDLDNAYATLADLRSTPCVWIGHDKYSALTAFGFFNSFEINIAYADYSDVSIDIEGLT